MQQPLRLIGDESELTDSHTFPSVGNAKAAYKKLIEEKVGKGYVELKKVPPKAVKVKSSAKVIAAKSVVGDKSKATRKSRTNNHEKVALSLTRLIEKAGGESAGFQINEIAPTLNLCAFL